MLSLQITNNFFLFYFLFLLGPEKKIFLEQKLGTPKIMVLTEKQLRNLKKYEYKKEGVSILEPYFDIWWSWAAQFMPMWIAPNMITLLGSSTVAIQCFIMHWYTGLTGTEHAPAWIYWSAALR